MVDPHENEFDDTLVTENDTQAMTSDNNDTPLGGTPDMPDPLPDDQKPPEDETLTPHELTLAMLSRTFNEIYSSAEEEGVDSFGIMICAKRRINGQEIPTATYGFGAFDNEMIGALHRMLHRVQSDMVNDDIVRQHQAMEQMQRMANGEGFTDQSSGPENSSNDSDSETRSTNPE